jgi:periplasmic nitrate reductase NapD
MNISSLVVRTRPECVAAVRAALGALPGVEVTSATDAGQLVVVADHDRSAAAADSFVAIHRIEGVLSVSLVYQYSDDAAVPEEV